MLKCITLLLKWFYVTLLLLYADAKIWQLFKLYVMLTLFIRFLIVVIFLENIFSIYHPTFFLLNPFSFWLILRILQYIHKFCKFYSEKLIWGEISLNYWIQYVQNNIKINREKCNILHFNLSKKGYFENYDKYDW